MPQCKETLANRQYLFYIVHLPSGFLDRAAGAAVFPLQQADDRIAVVSYDRQALLDRRVAGTQLDVGALVSLAVLNMDVRNAVVMLAKERRRVVVAGSVVTDVEVDHE